MKRSAHEKARQEKLLSHAESLKKRELFLNVAYQTACLDELYKELNLEPESSLISAGSRSSTMAAAGDKERKVQKKLRELKAALRKQHLVGQLHSLETPVIWMLFDADKRPFFKVEARMNDYPLGFPFLLDQDPNSLYVALSEKIYERVMLAIEDEGEKETNRTGEQSNVSSSSEHQLHEVSIKQEEEEEEEEGMEINLADDDDEAGEAEEHPTVAFERQQGEESAKRSAFEGNSFNRPASSASSSASTAVVTSKRFTANSNNNRFNISASSASAAVQPLQAIPSAESAGAVAPVLRTRAGPSSTKTPQTSTAPPPKLKGKAKAESNTSTHTRQRTVIKRPGTAPTPPSNKAPKRPHTSTPTSAIATGSSSSSFYSLADEAEKYLREKYPIYTDRETRVTDKILCQEGCQKPVAKSCLRMHLIAVHWQLKPYSCAKPGCLFSTGWNDSIRRHIQKAHNVTNADQITRSINFLDNLKRH